MNSLEHVYRNPTDNAFIYQNYVQDDYQWGMETLETVQHPCKVIVVDHGLGWLPDICHSGQGSVHKSWISVSDRKVPLT